MSNQQEHQQPHAACHAAARLPLQLDARLGGAVAILMESMSMKMAELRTARQGRNRAPRIFAGCTAPTLPYLIQHLTEEQIKVASELNSMEPDAWMTVQGRALANREQELHTTLRVLRGLVQHPLQIMEPGQ